MSNRLLALVLAGLAGLLLMAIAVAAWAILRDPAGEPEATDATQVALATSEGTAGATATIAETATRELPPPIVQVLPSDTPVPTNTPTDTPVPTETPLPTETPTETPLPPTNTAVPVVTRVLPTNTPVPAPPTNTPVPVNTNGLSATFSVEGTTFGTGQQIWFNFNVTNSSGGPVEFGALGAYPRLNGQDRLDRFQYSWTNEVIPTGGLEWRDNIILPDAGSYTLRLAICFDADVATCRGGGGRWVTLSQEVPITVQ